MYLLGLESMSKKSSVLQLEKTLTKYMQQLNIYS